MRALAALVLLAAALAGCSSTSRKPPVEVFPDMDRQLKLKAQAETSFFADRRASRPPVPGTVARGRLKEDTPFHTGLEDGAYVANPLPLSRELLERGRERYDIYCAPCHDRTGSGRGIVAQRSAWPAVNLNEPRYRQMPDGQIFETITHGRRTMPAYRFQIGERDRWAIVAYVRALQRASAGTLADVPPELRSELR